MLNTTPNYISYFSEPSSPNHRQYLALRMFFAEGCTAEQVSQKTGYSVGTIYAMVRDFKKAFNNLDVDPFFKENRTGRKPIDHSGGVEEIVISLRKKYLSVPDIQVVLNAQGIGMAIYSIEKIIKEAGFARLPRRDQQLRNEARSATVPKLEAPIASRLSLMPDNFSSHLAGLLCMMPYIVTYGIDKIIEQSFYPYTSDISRISSILSFLALKLCDVKRYSADDMWCMDRGMGLFARLNVLPKAAWFSSYSSAITRDMNVKFLKSLHTNWIKYGLLSDTANLDFTAIPYWGDDDHLENNWSGKRNKSLPSIQAVLAQDPESGLLCYGDTTIRHKNEPEVVLEFLDFYHHDAQKDGKLKYLIFDSKFTIYQNLNKLNSKGIKFITIRSRSKSLLERISQIEKWKKIRVQKADGKGRNVYVYEELGSIKDYDGQIRHVYIKDKSRTQPAIMISNDLEISLNELVRKYSRRWLVETDISEHIDFFHLNRNSSGIVIKVDFDLTMTILAHNLYRLFSRGLDGYAHCEAQSLFDKFISSPGQIEIDDDCITVKLKKRRTLPLILGQLSAFQDLRYPWLDNSLIRFSADSTT